MNPWLVIGIIGVGTYLMRLSFVALFGQSGVPPALDAPLRYVTPAILAALVAPAVVAPGGTLQLDPIANPRILAMVIAILVAVRTKSVVWSTVTGMAALWALKALF